MPASRPNLVVFHAHDLGQFLHCYGIPTVQTPHVDALAAQGVRFARSFCSAPSCSPSRAALFTGRYPHSNGVMGLCHADFAWDLNRGEVHMARCLQRAGYATVACGVVHETSGSPLGLGYDEHLPNGMAREAVSSAIGRLEGLAADRKPFYLFVGIVEPHRLPYPHAPGHTPGDSLFPGTHLQPDSELGVTVPPYLLDTPGARSEIAGLQGAVRHVDAQFGRLMEALRAKGLEEETVVVFTTDHGIAMPRAKCSLYEPGLQVALVIRLPGGAGGQVRDEMVQNIDVMPSLLDLLGIRTPRAVQGRSFAPLLVGGDYLPHDAIFGEMTYHDYYDPRRSIRTETHKLIANFTTAPCFMDPSQSWRPMSDTAAPPNHAMAYHPHLELYDLVADPWEQNDLARSPDQAEVLRDLCCRLSGHMEATRDPLLRGAVAGPHHRSTMAMLQRARTG